MFDLDPPMRLLLALAIYVAIIVASSLFILRPRDFDRRVDRRRNPGKP